MTGDATVRAMEAAEARHRLDELAALLHDAVLHGASVNFMAGFSEPEARRFWEGQVDGFASGRSRLLVAEIAGRIVGTATLFFATQPNAPHRAEIGKMLVHSRARRQGLGRRLLTAAEDEARRAGRTLLLLDTETGSAGDGLYRSCGWHAYGSVPGHAFRPDGRLAETTMFLKTLD